MTELTPTSRSPESLATAATRIDEYIDVPRISPLAGVAVYLLVALMLALGVWATLAQVDIVVFAQGKLIAPTEQISMQVFETSVVNSIDVRIGQTVTKGQVLATLDPTFTSSDRVDLESQVTALTAAMRRARAEIDGQEYNPQGPNASESAQVRIYSQRKVERESHLNSLVAKVSQLKTGLEFSRSSEPLLAKQLELARELVGINQALSDKGLGYSKQLVEAKSKELDALSKLSECQSDQRKYLDQIMAAEADRESYAYEWSRKLAEEYEKAAKDLDSATARLAKAKRRGDLIAMTAPMDGSVLDIPKRNVGSVLREGETLMTLVPSGAAMPLDVAIESKDVAYIRVGMPVQIKFEALPYQEYGRAFGTLTIFTSDTTTDNPVSEDQSGTNSNRQGLNNKRYYRGQVSIDREEFRNLPAGFQLRPGMRAVAEIKAGLRTVSAFILHPITRVFNESLHER
jgi:hemolysin D